MSYQRELKSCEDERYTPRCNFWLHEYRLRNPQFIQAAEAVLAKEKQLLMRDEVLDYFASIIHPVEDGINADEVQEKRKCLKKEFLDSDNLCDAAVSDIFDLSNYNTIFPLSGDTLRQALAILSDCDRVSDLYKVSYRLKPDAERIMSFLVEGQQLIKWRDIETPNCDTPYSLLGVDRNDSKIKMQGNTIKLEFDIRLPRKALIEQFTYIIDFLIFNKEKKQSRCNHGDIRSICCSTQRQAAEAMYHYLEDKDNIRVAGLWIYDYIQKHKSKQIEAINQFRKQYSEHLEELDLEREDSDFRHFYRKTCCCIEQGKVLSFSKS